MDNYLLPMFYTMEPNALLTAFQKWITTDLITTDGDTLALYQQVELVALRFGLALRRLWIAQFTNLYNRVPASRLLAFGEIRMIEPQKNCIQGGVVKYPS